VKEIDHIYKNFEIITAGISEFYISCSSSINNINNIDYYGDIEKIFDQVPYQFSKALDLKDDIYSFSNVNDSSVKIHDTGNIKLGRKIFVFAHDVGLRERGDITIHQFSKSSLSNVWKKKYFLNTIVITNKKLAIYNFQKIFRFANNGEKGLDIVHDKSTILKKLTKFLQEDKKIKELNGLIEIEVPNGSHNIYTFNENFSDEYEPNYGCFIELL
tara:strand:+ start:120 stop:764 length:645 start_codon:yes stop_codon:yes gene_type:complete